MDTNRYYIDIVNTDNIGHIYNTSADFLFILFLENFQRFFFSYPFFFLFIFFILLYFFFYFEKERGNNGFYALLLCKCRTIVNLDLGSQEDKFYRVNFVLDYAVAHKVTA